MVLQPKLHSIPRQRSLWRNATTRAKVFMRKWRTLFYETTEILEPIDTAILVVTHILFVFAEDLLATTGLFLCQEFPREVRPRGHPRGTVVLATGLQQTPFSCYPFAWFLAHVFHLRVLLLQTSKRGNEDSFQELVIRNNWIINTHVGPFIGIGFSKGGHDLVWLLSTLLTNDPSRRAAVVMMSTPLRGTKMAKVVKTRGAQALLPGASEIASTLHLVDHLHQTGVHFKFYCAIWDRIVRRSDSRPVNVDRYNGTGCAPWYWSQTLWFQFGHTAIYNPFAWIQVGRYVSRLIPQLS